MNPCAFIALNPRTLGALAEPPPPRQHERRRRSGPRHPASPFSERRYRASFAASLTSCEPITLRWIWFVPS
jgi:hypothetical protein